MTAADLRIRLLERLRTKLRTPRPRNLLDAPWEDYSYEEFVDDLTVYEAALRRELEGS